VAFCLPVPVAHDQTIIHGFNGRLISAPVIALPFSIPIPILTDSDLKVYPVFTALRNADWSAIKKLSFIKLKIGFRL
jgi:hypothetical protein